MINYHWSSILWVQSMMTRKLSIHAPTQGATSRYTSHLASEAELTGDMRRELRPGSAMRQDGTSTLQPPAVHNVHNNNTIYILYICKYIICIIYISQEYCCVKIPVTQ